MSASETKEGIVDKLASMKVLIAVAVFAVLGIGMSVQAAGARPCDPDCVVVPKALRSPPVKRLPSEPSAPAWAQFTRIPGTDRYRAQSVHGGLDD
jgi:hypothetical protein